MTTADKLCPCFSGKKYEECCKPFHDGALTKNALQLMRSRYTAFALNLPDYIIQTTHPANSQYSENKFSWKRHIAHRSETSIFNKLEILDFKEKGNYATVTFTVTVTQNNEQFLFTEKSVFEKKEGRWLYLSGRFEEGRATHLVTPGELKILPLAYYGNPILRKRCEPVAEITPEIRKLVEEMIESMDTYDGIGLAAPQVHHSLRLFVMRKPDERENGEVKVIINPTLSEPSDETWEAPEGCLSIPQIRENVKRPKAITIEYTTLEGNRVKERVTEWEAKVMMHENDHINGVLYIDRFDPETRAKWDPLLGKIEKRLKK
jgi:peptide deformylase